MIRVLGSSSKGNCYLIETSEETLILELGVSFTEIKKALDFNLSKVAGCLVSHRHRDHSLSVTDMINKASIPVYAACDVFINCGLEFHRKAKIIEDKGIFEVGGFKVYAFPLLHKDFITGEYIETFGFYIHHAEVGTIYFATDTSVIDTRPPQADLVLIEDNYSLEVLKAYTEDVEDEEGHLVRLINSHMAHEVLLQTLEKWKNLGSLDTTQMILLIHTSDKFGEPGEFAEEIEKKFNINTIVAKKGGEY